MPDSKSGTRRPRRSSISVPASLTFNRELFDKLTSERGAKTVEARARVAGTSRSQVYRLYGAASDQNARVSMAASDAVALASTLGVDFSDLFILRAATGRTRVAA